MQMLKAYAKDFWRYRYLLQNLIGRDFKLKYRRSVLGRGVERAQPAADECRHGGGVFHAF